MHQVINRVTGTLESLKNITDAANQCTSSVAKISETNQQQLRLLQDIVAALEKSSEVSKANRIQAEGVNWTAKTLGHLGSQMGSSLELFRTVGKVSNAIATPSSPASSKAKPMATVTKDQAADSVETHDHQYALEG